MSSITRPTRAGSADGGKGVPNRRNFLYLTTAAVGSAGLAATAWPFIDSMNPASDTLALATIEVDISAIAVGQMIVVSWQGKPIFIRHRTPDEIKDAKAVDLSSLYDPEDDAKRAPKPEWLILVGVCSHLGCVPIFDGTGSARQGEFGGWFCPCHGSQFDISGRIRKGPAPTNLPVPRYTFLTDTVIKIG